MYMPRSGSSKIVGNTGVCYSFRLPGMLLFPRGQEQFVSTVCHVFASAGFHAVDIFHLRDAAMSGDCDLDVGGIWPEY